MRDAGGRRRRDVGIAPYAGKRGVGDAQRAGEMVRRRGEEGRLDTGSAFLFGVQEPFLFPQEEREMGLEKETGGRIAASVCALARNDRDGRRAR